MKIHGAVLLICAWVLWSDGFHKQGKERYIDMWGGFETLAKCEVSQKNMEEVAKKSMAEPSSPISSVRYLCLPDTVDLRAPK